MTLRRWLGSKFVYVIVVIHAVLSFPGPLLSQQQALPPQNIEVCILKQCQHLVWNGDHYDGRDEDTNALSDRYTVKRWDSDGIVIVGTPVVIKDASSITKITVSGRMSPLHNATLDGKILVEFGVRKGETGVDVTWDPGDIRAQDRMPDPPFRLNSIIDVVKPEEGFFVPNLTTVAWQPVQNPVTNSDLNGVWENLEGADHVERVTVFQLRDRILVTNVLGRRDFLPNAPLFDGKFTTSNSAGGNVTIADHGDMNMKGIPATLIVLSNNRFDISDGSKYRRVSTNIVRDMQCDYRNPAHVSGDDAFHRGFIYERDVKLGKNFETMLCWYYVAASQGSSPAEAAYGAKLLDGSPEDIQQGILWIQRAAMSGDHLYADGAMMQVFAKGIGLPASREREAYWRARVLGSGLLFVHEAERNRPQPWMSHTAEPCQISNPAHINGDDALRKGRVAYQARAMQNAHCWFRVSAAQGNIKAVTYLGIQSTFGLGVKRNLRNGYLYMRHAALQNDMFARVYLANFLIYGIGTPKDQHEGDVIMTSVTQTAEGNDAYDRVQGLLVTPGEALNAFIGLVNSEENEATCRQSALILHRQNVDCENDEALDSIKGLAAGARGHRTLANREEIYPEVPFWHE